MMLIMTWMDLIVDGVLSTMKWIRMDTLRQLDYVQKVVQEVRPYVLPPSFVLLLSCCFEAGKTAVSGVPAKKFKCQNSASAQLSKTIILRH